MIKIISDSTCDLSEGLLGKYNISILPLHVILDKSDYRDGVDITTDEIYDWADDHRTTPKTAAPSIEEAINLFKPILEGDNEIICFSLAKDMSNSYDVMKLAAKTLEAEDRIYVIDSANLSTGIGLLVLEAATLAAQGMSAENIVARIEELKPLVRSSFVADSLTYLYHGGRCDSVTTSQEGVLKLHSLVEVEDGKLVVSKEYREDMNAAIMTYVKELEPALSNAKADHVFITYTGYNDAIIADVHDYLERLNHFKEIHITRAGAVISSHCGYGALGVVFIAN